MFFNIFVGYSVDNIKTTVLQNFLIMKHVDKNDQHSLFFRYTIYGMRFFAEFLKRLRMAIALCSREDDFFGAHYQFIHSSRFGTILPLANSPLLIPFPEQPGESFSRHPCLHLIVTSFQGPRLDSHQLVIDHAGHTFRLSLTTFDAGVPGFLFPACRPLLTC